MRTGTISPVDLEGARQLLGTRVVVVEMCGETCTLDEKSGVAHQSAVLQFSNGPRRAQVVMIDPVNVLLSQPDVAFNFLYRRPASLGNSLPEPYAHPISRTPHMPL